MTARALIVVPSLILAAALLPGQAANRTAVETYKIDSVHSSAIFRIKHLNTSYFYGRFNDISGTINWDDANPDAASFDIQIKTESIDTKDSKRNNHLKSPDFFTPSSSRRSHLRAKAPRKSQATFWKSRATRRCMA
jgi:polyisoprenoid-binding protein YceI